MAPYPHGQCVFILRRKNSLTRREIAKDVLDEKQKGECAEGWETEQPGTYVDNTSYPGLLFVLEDELESELH